MDLSERLFEYRGHWLVRRSDTPSLYIYWCRPNTRRVRRKSTGSADLDTAKRVLIEFVDRKLPPPEPLSLSPPTRPPIMPPGVAAPVLMDLVCSYVERLPTERRAKQVAKTSLRLFAEFCEREDIVHVDEFTLDVQERFSAWRRVRLDSRGRPGSNATINRDFSVVKAALRDAWKRGRLPSVPYVLGLPNPPGRTRTLHAEECRRLLDACDEIYLYRTILLLLHTLQRPSAIFGLHKTQVDLGRSRIDFLPFGSVQSKKRRPVVPITPTLGKELTTAVAESQSGYVIEKDGKRINGVRRSFPAACRRAGLIGVTPYTLRHTGATLLAASGVPMRQIAGMLGHTTQKTTEIYAKHAPEYLTDAAQAIEGMFGCAPGARQLRAKRAPEDAVMPPLGGDAFLIPTATAEPVRGEAA